MMAANDERQENNMLEALSADILTHTLGFLDIVDRIQLAATNATLQRRVYRECPQAWSRISFRCVKFLCCSRLTDLDLSRLLSNVNAVEVTSHLSLTGCFLIEGFGLAPLANSRVLETMSLMATSVQTDPTFVFWILRSMFPFKLHLVSFPYTYTRNPDEGLISFLRDFRTSAFEKCKRDEDLKCGACNLPLVMGPTLQLPSAFAGPPSFTCDSCCKRFCRRGSCVVSVRECCDCRYTSCDSCDGVRISQCNFCGVTCCRLCHEMNECSSCQTVSCKDCERVYDCFVCKATFCTDCKAPDECSICSTTFCETHNRMVDCEACGIRHCRICGNENSCKSCGVPCYLHCVCGNRNQPDDDDRNQPDDDDMSSVESIL